MVGSVARIDTGPLSSVPRLFFLALLAGCCVPAAEAATKHKPPAVTPTGAMVTSVPTGTRPVAIPYGSYCLTPLGRVGPGLVAPLGSPCTGSSAQGPVAGQTVD